GLPCPERFRRGRDATTAVLYSLPIYAARAEWGSQATRAGSRALHAPGSGLASEPRRSAARVAELADALDLGSSGETRGGSNPPSRTFAIPLVHPPQDGVRKRS